LISISACTNSPSGFIQDPNSVNSVNDVAVSSTTRTNAVVEIKLKNAKNDLIALSTSGYDLFGFDASKKTIRARVSQDEQNKLSQKKYSFTMILENNMDSKGLLPGYMSADQMNAKLQALASQNPNIAKVSPIGQTWEKNNIFVINITSSKNPDPKPGSLFIGGMHARELAPPEIMYKLAEQLITQYGKDPAITELVDTRDISIVPMVNVDGRKQVEKGNN